ncbi:hypothetical protein SAMN02744778_02234 [Pantoea sp. GL120224-02]|nr:hypothetical protein SAMN02744778_02234 [Pantoea sp. GL120224-02]
MSQPDLQCIGIDVAKATLDVASTEEIIPFTVSNDTAGFEVITKKISGLNISLILMEATGGMEAERSDNLFHSCSDAAMTGDIRGSAAAYRAALCPFLLEQDSIDGISRCHQLNPSFAS